MRVSRVALDAYQRRLRNGKNPPVSTPEPSVEMDELHAEFERDTGLTPREWERRWKAEEIEDSAENMRLTIRALTLHLAKQQRTAARRKPLASPARRSTPVSSRQWEGVGDRRHAAPLLSSSPGELPTAAARPLAAPEPPERADTRGRARHLRADLLDRDSAARIVPRRRRPDLLDVPSPSRATTPSPTSSRCSVCAAARLRQLPQRACRLHHLAMRSAGLVRARQGPPRDLRGDAAPGPGHGNPSASSTARTGQATYSPATPSGSPGQSWCS